MSNRRPEVQEEKVREIYNEILPYLEEIKTFNAFDPPLLSANARCVLTTIDAIRQFRDYLQVRLPTDDFARESCEDDVQDLRKSYIVLCLNDLLKSLSDGTNHPLLDLWQFMQRQDLSSPLRARRSVDYFKRKVAVFARALELSGIFPTKIDCRRQVAEVLTQTGVYLNCRETTIKAWLLDLRPSDERQAKEIAKEFSDTPNRIIEELRTVVVELAPDLTALKQQRSLKNARKV